MTKTIAQITKQFISELDEAIREQAHASVRAAVLDGMGRRGGAPTSSASAARAAHRSSSTHKAQLCPVPGCKNRAAPVFHMVCADHKDMPKSKIRAFRQARRERKAAGR